jgi:hypothetical protein
MPPTSLQASVITRDHTSQPSKQANHQRTAQRIDRLVRECTKTRKQIIKHKPTNDRETPHIQPSIHPLCVALRSTAKSCVCESRAEPLATAAAATAARQTMEPAFLAFAAARDLSSSIAAFDVLQQHTSKTDISDGPVAGSITLLNELSRVVLPTGADLYNALGPRLEQASSRG